MVPVQINGAITLKFTLDSGATDVTIPADVFSTLVRAGTIEDTDMLETKTYTLADGSTNHSQTFRIRSLKVGDTLLENVVGSVSDTKGMLLLVNRRSNGPFGALSASKRDPLAAQGFGRRDYQDERRLFERNRLAKLLTPQQTAEPRS